MHYTFKVIHNGLPMPGWDKPDVVATSCCSRFFSRLCSCYLKDPEDALPECSVVLRVRPVLSSSHRQRDQEEEKCGDNEGQASFIVKLLHSKRAQRERVFLESLGHIEEVEGFSLDKLYSKPDHWQKLIARNDFYQVRVLDDGLPYLYEDLSKRSILMKMIIMPDFGKDLLEWLTEKRGKDQPTLRAGLSLNERIRILSILLDRVSIMTFQGRLIHRDLKADNVFVPENAQQQPDWDQLMLGDLGLAKKGSHQDLSSLRSDSIGLISPRSNRQSIISNGGSYSGAISNLIGWAHIALQVLQKGRLRGACMVSTYEIPHRLGLLLTRLLCSWTLQLKRLDERSLNALSQQLFFQSGNIKVKRQVSTHAARSDRLSHHKARLINVISEESEHIESILKRMPSALKILASLLFRILRISIDGKELDHGSGCCCCSKPRLRVSEEAAVSFDEVKSAIDEAGKLVLSSQKERAGINRVR